MARIQVPFSWLLCFSSGKLALSRTWLLSAQKLPKLERLNHEAQCRLCKLLLKTGCQRPANSYSAHPHTSLHDISNERPIFRVLSTTVRMCTFACDVSSVEGRDVEGTRVAGRDREGQMTSLPTSTGASSASCRNYSGDTRGVGTTAKRAGSRAYNGGLPDIHITFCTYPARTRSRTSRHGPGCSIVNF